MPRQDEEHDRTLRSAQTAIDAQPGCKFYILHQGRVRGTPNA